jgi:hypothetical protein
VLTDDEVKGLFVDSLVRHEKAFGGKAFFLRWANSLADWKVDGCKESRDGYCAKPPYEPTILPFILEILNNYRSK